MTTAIRTRKVKSQEDLDYELAFEMLDTDEDGYLGFDEAMTWLRCLGWCQSDVELKTRVESCLQDSELRPPRPKSSVFRVDLQDLKELARRHSHDRGPDRTRLVQALKVFDETGEGLVDATILATYLVETGTMQEEDVADMYHLLGLAPAKIGRRQGEKVQLDELVDALNTLLSADLPRRPEKSSVPPPHAGGGAAGAVAGVGRRGGGVAIARTA
jgi:Ca2+-binding EF-hand superfamily protein